MPVFLYGVGALVFAIGVASVGFGIPNNEFGIGNTLIVAGVTAAAGGLIVIGLGVVVAQLQRIVEALGTRAPVRASRQFEPFEPAAQPQAEPGRIPFPPRPKPEAKLEAKPESRAEIRSEAPPKVVTRDQFMPESRMEPPAPPSAPIKERDSDYFAPHLPNPDEPPVTVADEVHLSPLHPAAPPPAFLRSPEPPASRTPEPAADRDEHFTPPPARPPHTYFDAMWPAEPKAPEPKPAEPKPTEFSWSEARRGDQGLGKAQPTNQPPADDETHEAVTGHQPAEPAEPLEEEEPRAVAILKSGVVDGMGYTLYVDGSIEAELPQGTLRFASINELRSHLEKTS